MLAETFGCAVFAIDQHDHIFDPETILFEKMGSFQNATASRDQIINNERCIASFKTTLNAAFAGSLRACASVDHRNIGLKRVGRGQQQASHRHTSHNGEGMDPWTP